MACVKTAKYPFFSRDMPCHNIQQINISRRTITQAKLMTNVEEVPV
jgi:hypothetical protein